MNANAGRVEVPMRLSEQPNAGDYRHFNSIFLGAIPDHDRCLDYVEEDDMQLPEHMVAAENLTETVKVCDAGRS